MNVFSPTTIQRIIRQPRLWLIIGSVLILYSFVFERSGFIRQLELKRENKRLQQQIILAQERMVFLQGEINALKNDIERMKQEAIRNGYAESDEVIVRIR
ncbi:MAG: hypothetical protein EHM72_02780 [Calditrichaeota bacterium]|nr:MAG: hypothetical protein EHM72_02780 [Calditrichota bacterium]